MFRYFDLYKQSATSVSRSIEQLSRVVTRRLLSSLKVNKKNIVFDESTGDLQEGSTILFTADSTLAELAPELRTQSVILKNLFEKYAYKKVVIRAFFQYIGKKSYFNKDTVLVSGVHGSTFQENDMMISKDRGQGVLSAAILQQNSTDPRIFTQQNIKPIYEDFYYHVLRIFRHELQHFHQSIDVKNPREYRSPKPQYYKGTDTTDPNNIDYIKYYLDEREIDANVSEAFKTFKILRHRAKKYKIRAPTFIDCLKNTVKIENIPQAENMSKDELYFHILRKHFEHAKNKYGKIIMSAPSTSDLPPPLPKV